MELVDFMVLLLKLLVGESGYESSELSLQVRR